MPTRHACSPVLRRCLFVLALTAAADTSHGQEAAALYREREMREGEIRRLQSRADELRGECEKLATDRERAIGDAGVLYRERESREEGPLLRRAHVEHAAVAADRERPEDADLEPHHAGIFAGAGMPVA